MITSVIVATGNQSVTSFIRLIFYFKLLGICAVIRGRPWEDTVALCIFLCDYTIRSHLDSYVTAIFRLNADITMKFALRLFTKFILKEVTWWHSGNENMVMILWGHLFRLMWPSFGQNCKVSRELFCDKSPHPIFLCLLV